VSTCTSHYILVTSSTIQRSAGAGTAVLTDEKPRLVDGNLLWQEKEAICSEYNDPQATIPCKAVKLSTGSCLVLSWHREVCAT
jgi:hypothetical protein